MKFSHHHLSWAVKRGNSLKNEILKPHRLLSPSKWDPRGPKVWLLWTKHRSEQSWYSSKVSLRKVFYESGWRYFRSATIRFLLQYYHYEYTWKLQGWQLRNLLFSMYKISFWGEQFVFCIGLGGNRDFISVFIIKSLQFNVLCPIFLPVNVTIFTTWFNATAVIYNI